MINKNHPLYKEDLHSILQTHGLECLRGKTVLITGATGLIGVHLIDALMLQGEIRIIAVGRNKAKAQERLGEYFNAERFAFLEHDVMHPFPADLKPDYIVPLASNTHPKAYSEFPVETLLINTLGCQHALELARQCNACVVYPSSVEIYGNARDADIFTEDYTGALNLANARACYPESKRASEAMCLSYAAEYGVKVKIVRLSRVFGPTMLTSDTKASSQFIKKALANEDIVLKSDGSQFFSYTYTTDAVSALLHVMLNGEDSTPYNISHPSCDVHLRDFANCCAEAVGRKVVFDLPDDVERRGFSIATQAILSPQRLIDSGWNAHYDIRQAIQRTILIMKG